MLDVGDRLKCFTTIDEALYTGPAIVMGHTRYGDLLYYVFVTEDGRAFEKSSTIVEKWAKHGSIV